MHWLDSTSMESVREAIRSVAIGAGIIQCLLAIETYFSRGAITIDRMFVRSVGQEPAGPALVKAVELEKDYAISPRVIAHEHVYGASHELQLDINQRKIFVFDFQMPFLDYLSFADLLNPDEPRRAIAWHAEEVHKLVELAHSAPEIAEKARWLHWYHNWHVQSRGNSDQLMIKIDPPQAELDPQE